MDATMAASGTLTAALEAHKAVIPKRLIGSWSSCTLDGEAVVGQFWADQFVSVYGHLFYIGQSVEDHERDGFKDGYGFKKWRRHLDWACDTNRSILIIEAQRGSPHKYVGRKYAVMKLIALDRATGAFVAREEPA
jgi:hypothetical protein